MNRKEAISYISILLGGTIAGANIFLSGGCRPSPEKNGKLFSDADIIFLNEVGEVILPETKSPGAKAADVGSFMAIMVTDCYEIKDQKIFIEGMSKLDNACKKMNGKNFLECDALQRTKICAALDQEQKIYTEKKKPDDPSHYFRLIKELTLLGYFTSEPGCTKGLRHEAVPGKYIGDIPYKKGDRAWSIS